MKRCLLFLFVLCLFHSGYAQTGNLDKALQNAYDQAKAKKRKEMDDKLQQAIDNAISAHKYRIHPKSVDDNTPDVYYLTIDGYRYSFSNSTERDNAKNNFVNNAANAAMSDFRNSYPNQSIYTVTDIRTKINNRCSVQMSKNIKYRAPNSSNEVSKFSESPAGKGNEPIYQPGRPTQYANSTENQTQNKSTDLLPSRDIFPKSQPLRQKTYEEMKVNMQIQQSQQAPEMINTIDAEKERRERIAALNPFSKEALELKKKALEKEYDEILRTCNKSSEFDCLNRLKPIIEELDAIKEREKGREEWLKEVEIMKQNGTLETQEKKYQKLVDMASMSDFCYKDKESLLEKDLPSGWKEVKMDDTLGKIMANANNNNYGFQCSLLYNEETGKYVLAFRGTEFGRELYKDVVNADIGGSIWQSEQTKLALRTVDTLIKSKVIKEGGLELTGHSLGGGHAMEAAIKYNLTAYTFDPKGISDATHEELARNNYNLEGKGIIHNVVTANDPVQKIQNTVSEYVAPVINVAKDMLNPMFGVSVEKTNPINVRPIGGMTVIQEAYGKEIIAGWSVEGHRIAFIRQAIEQRTLDLKSKRSEKL